MERPRTQQRQTKAELFQELEENLRIDDDHLERSIQSQPVLFYEISRMLAVETSRRDAAKQSLEEVKAKVDARVRRDIEIAGDKIREADVGSQVLLDSDVKQAIDVLQDLNKNVGRYAALKEAYSQRSYMLKELVSLYLNDYYGEHQPRGAEHYANIRGQQAREAMAAARRASSK